MIKKSLKIVLIICLIIVNKTVNAISINDIQEEALDARQKAIYNTAKAFYYRGNTIQYFSSNLTYKFSYGKKSHEYHQIPEDATIYTIQNMDCTSFVYSVFENAFTENGKPYKIGGLSARDGMSKNFIDLADENSEIYNESIAAFYVDKPNEYAKQLFATGDSKETRKDKFINAVNLQPGDIIAYYYNDGSGHALIYLGDDLVINSSQSANNVTASNYAFYSDDDIKLAKHNNFNDYGTIGVVSLKNNVTSTTTNDINKYLFSSTITRLAILRPLNILDDSNISESAKIRNDYSDLIINKTSSTKANHSVNPGDSITYYITIENASSNKLYSVSVSDIIPEGTTYFNFTGDGIYSGEQLSWNFNLAPNESKKISYTVKVNFDKQLLGTYITSNNTKVNGLKINEIKTFVNHTLTSNTQEKLVNIVRNSINTTYQDNDNIANIIYSHIDKKFIPFDNKTIDDILNDYFLTTTKLCVRLTGSNDCEGYSNIVNLNATNTKIFGTGEKQAYTVKNEKGNMYIDTLFGGLYALEPYKNYNISINPDRQDNRKVRLDESDFIIGDILIVYDDDYEVERQTLNYVVKEKNMYMYIGSGEFATLDEDNKLVIIDEKAWEKIKVYDTQNSPKNPPETITRETTRSKLIESLPAQNVYIVLRPSYAGFKGLRGDMNDNSIIDLNDIILLLKKYLTIEDVTIADIQVGDMDDNYKIGLQDIILLLKEYLAFD